MTRSEALSPDGPRRDPRQVMEEKYSLPYHWFPKKRREKFDWEEKQRIVFSMLDRHLPAPPDRYLDLGCGDGRWTADIHRHFAGNPRTTGVDISERALAFARLITPEVEFLQSDGAALSLPNQAFDLITAIEVIEHLPDHQEIPFLEAAVRSLRPGGLFLLTTPSENLRLSEHHFRHYTEARLRQLLSDRGLTVLEVRGQSRPCYGWQRKARSYLNEFPKLWKLTRYYHRETSPGQALTLFISARMDE